MAASVWREGRGDLSANSRLGCRRSARVPSSSGDCETTGDARGFKGDFSAHSLRSGFMTEAGRQNTPLGEAMALTGHRSVQTALKYFQTGAVQQTRAANLLKGSPAEEA
jgi:integrase